MILKTPVKPKTTKFWIEAHYILPQYKCLLNLLLLIQLYFLVPLIYHLLRPIQTLSFLTTALELENMNIQYIKDLLNKCLLQPIELEVISFYTTLPQNVSIEFSIASIFLLARAQLTLYRSARVQLFSWSWYNCACVKLCWLVINIFTWVNRL